VLSDLCGWVGGLSYAMSADLRGTMPRTQYSDYGVIDLCCGMGGLALAAEQLGMVPLLGVDLDRHAGRTFERNFGEGTFRLGDIADDAVIEACVSAVGRRTDLTGTVVVSGPPCQGFSPAGPRSVDDPRNELLVKTATAIARIRPCCALVENVSALAAGRHRPFVKRFLAVLRSAGFRIRNFVLDAQDYGVPQRRRRSLYLILPATVSSAGMSARLRGLCRSAPTVREAFRGLGDAPPRPLEYRDAEEGPEGFHNHYAMRHSERVREKIRGIPIGKGPLSYRKLSPDRTAYTLLSGHRAPPAHYEFPRSITVREAARLQGVPDSFRIYGTFASQMRQVTNSVPPPLAEAALKVLMMAYGREL
jgi:DNA (cytosine-5)-methyltransferase 1